jgi:hypothetical protein
MAAPARQQGDPRPRKPRPPRVRRPPITYTVEVVATQPDPEVARKVADWFRAKLR